jgi:hypothetical protein
MLDNLAVLKPENVEADLGAKEIVVGVRDDEVAVLEDTNRVRLGRVRRKRGDEGSKAGETVCGIEVVLGIALRVDNADRLGGARLDGLEQIDDLLFLGGHFSLHFGPLRLRERKCSGGEYSAWLSVKCSEPHRWIMQASVSKPSIVDVL